MQNALEASLEFSKLVKKAPKCESQLITIHIKGLFTENDEQNKTKTIRVFSDTRWTVRCGALVSIIQHHEKLKELCLKEYKDTETKARIIGVQTQMNKFHFFLESNQLFFYCDIVIILVQICKAGNSLLLKLNR